MRYRNHKMGSLHFTLTFLTMAKQECSWIDLSLLQRLHDALVRGMGLDTTTHQRPSAIYNWIVVASI